MRDPWLRYTLALLGGGLLGVYTPLGLWPWVLGILFLMGARLAFWRPRDFFGRLYRSDFLLCSASCLAGFLLGVMALVSLPAPVVWDRVQVTGTLLAWDVRDNVGSGVFRLERLSPTPSTAAAADALPDGASGAAGAAGIPLGGGLGKAEPEPGSKFRLAVYGDGQTLTGAWAKVRPGDAVSFAARLEQAKPAGTPGGFDRRLYYAARGWRGLLTARSEVQILTAGQPSWAWRLRQRVRQELLSWDPGLTGTLEGIMFGDSAGIPPEVQERYRVTGVLHVFAASGSNVAFVLALCWALLRFAPAGLRIGGSIAGIVFYALLCGESAPILRATVLATAVLLSRLGRGTIATVRWLGLAAAGLFIGNPIVLRDAGFQLSFLAAWGLMVLAPRLLAWPGWERWPASLRSALATTLAAQLAVLPVLISTFQRLSLIGFVTNLLILFVLGAVLELGLLGVVASFAPVLAMPLFQAALWLLQLTDWVLAQLAALPWADFWVVDPGLLFVLGWYGGLAVYLGGSGLWSFRLRVAWRRLALAAGPWLGRLLRLMPSACRERLCRLKRTRPAGRPIAQDAGAIRSYRRWLALGALALLLWSPWDRAGSLEVIFLDVGQGDSILIRTPHSHAVLIDTGPRTEEFDAGERLVIPFLLHERIKSLDALLLTHEHMDHTGGARAILANLPVGWIGVPAVGERLDSAEWTASLPVGLRAKTAVRELHSGDRIMLDGGAWLEVLGPERILTGTHSDANNNSLVTALHYAGQTVLLPADMEKEEIQALSRAGIAWEADFFKEPHHGSYFSLVPEMFDVIDPQAVFISVGKNTFGHPAQEVLDYWAGRHVPVYRTDAAGTVRLRLSPRGGEILTGRQT